MRAALLLALPLVAFACARNETTASKSAAAYREAQAKGTAVTGGHEHGGHEATSSASDEAAPMDHSAHGTGADPHAGHEMAGGTMDHSAQGTMDHGAHGTTDHGAHGAVAAADHSAHSTTEAGHAGHGTPGQMTDHSAHAAAATVDHAQHGGASGGHAAHMATAATHDQHGAMQQATTASPHAQHQQSNAPVAHAGHGQPAADAPVIELNAPTSSSDMARTTPAATLQPDAFDAPASISVEEAQKAAGGQKTTTDPHAGHGVKKEQ